MLNGGEVSHAVYSTLNTQAMHLGKEKRYIISQLLFSGNKVLLKSYNWRFEATGHL